MNTGSLKLGKLFGIAVNMHWSVALIGMLLGASLGNAIGWLPAALGVVGFLASILVHEFAHALTARRFDVGTESIQLWALGGIARLSKESPTAKAEGWIAVAGPAASVVLGIAGVGGWFALGGRDSTSEHVALLGWLGLINLLLALFNLLPGAPLDGGRILKAVRWGAHGDRHRAAQEAGRAGVVLGWLIAGLGFGLILRSQSGVWLMVTGLFIMLNAQVEIAAARIAGRLAGVKVRDLTWFGVAQAGADMDADSMLWQRRPARRRRGRGRYRRVGRALRSGAGGRTVGGACRSASLGDAHPDDGAVRPDRPGRPGRRPLCRTPPPQPQTPGRDRMERRRAGRHGAAAATQGPVDGSRSLT